MKHVILLFLLMLGISTVAYAGKVYKWLDEKGQVHYSTFPPTKTEAENVRIPSAEKLDKAPTSESRKQQRSFKGHRYSASAEERKKLYEEQKQKQAAQAYDRKYGAQARLRRLEEEKRRKKIREEEIYRERIRQSEQAKKDKEFERKWKQLVDKVEGLKDECEAAHGTDCGDPAYLRSWVNKKYRSKN